MANSYTYQVLKDDTQHAIIKLTARFDGTGQEDDHFRIKANSLSGALATNGYPVMNVAGYAANTALPYYGLSLYRLWYDCDSTGDVSIFWHADTAQAMFMLNGNGEYDAAGNWVTIPNNAKGMSGCLGDIGVQTRGMTANCSYTMIFELRKHNEYYSRGQFQEPAAFNYRPYGVTPGIGNG